MQGPRKKLAILTVVYWFLLAYISAALVWWFIALDQQNNNMAALRISEILPSDPAYAQKVAAVKDYQQRKHGQYIGEGITFMLVILAGALFVYRATRRYLMLGQQQQNFMMAVTHELKTPIAVARLNLETLQRRKLEAPQQERLLQQTLSETDRLNDLCNNILLASRFEGGAVAAHREPVDLTDLADTCVNEFRQRYPHRPLDARLEAEITVHGDPLQLKLLLNNLLDNAAKYAPASKPIAVRLEGAEGRAVLRVMDEGPGIPPAERSQVFEKFYRQGNESTRSQKGTGLGLFLARKIAEAHGGTIAISDNAPNGAIFTVSLSTL